MRKILLAGYYGYGNIGDEAILEMILKQLCQVESISKENITVLSGNPKRTSKKYNINAINRYNVFYLIKAILKNSILVIGGGSLLQDVTSKKSIYYYLFVIKLAQIARKKVIMLSQGIGPINNKISFKVTASILKKTDVITVRDNNSKKIIEDMGVDKSKIYFSADPVITYGSEINYENKNKDMVKVCFSLRKHKNNNNIDEICKVIDKLNENNIMCYLIPFHYYEDMEVLTKIENRLGNKCKYIKKKLSALEVYKIISEMNLLVGIRLHSLVFAASAGVPIIAISYDPKIDFFMENLDMNILCDVEGLNFNILYKDIINKLSNADMEKKELNKNVGKLIETTLTNVEVLREIL